MEMDKALTEYLEKVDRYLRPMVVSERVDIVQEEICTSRVERYSSLGISGGASAVRQIFSSRNAKKFSYAWQMLVRSQSIEETAPKYKNTMCYSSHISVG